MINRDEILKGQVCPQVYEANLQSLLVALNQFREVWGQPMIVSSGYRTVEHNEQIGGAKDSAHCLCMAADIWDKDRSVSKYCVQNQDLLSNIGLYIEHNLWTPTWVHFQIRPTSSRFFIP